MDGDVEAGRDHFAHEIERARGILGSLIQPTQYQQGLKEQLQVILGYTRLLRVLTAQAFEYHLHHDRELQNPFSKQGT